MPESNAKRYWKEKAERLQSELDQLRNGSPSNTKQIIAAKQRQNASTQVTGTRLSRELRMWAQDQADKNGQDLGGYIRSLIESDRLKETDNA